MRNIWTVFKTDIRTLSKCFFACVVVVAIALLPSLYAWLNIYSNWDPYGNTGGISIAVASLDEGYTDEDGTYENKGDDVVADLREATSINWVIVDTEEEAKGGVESGDYYAAVVIDKQFSRNFTMYIHTGQIAPHTNFIIYIDRSQQLPILFFPAFVLSQQTDAQRFLSSFCQTCIVTVEFCTGNRGQKCLHRLRLFL